MRSTARWSRPRRRNCAATLATGWPAPAAAARWAETDELARRIETLERHAPRGRIRCSGAILDLLEANAPGAAG